MRLYQTSKHTFELIAFLLDGLFNFTITVVKEKPVQVHIQKMSEKRALIENNKDERNRRATTGV
jgi:hypothetical protein